MAMNIDPIFVQELAGKLTVFNNAGGTTVQDITTADSTGPVRIASLSVANDNDADVKIEIWLSDGANEQRRAVVNVPANSLLNSGANAPLNLLEATNLRGMIERDSAGNPFIELPRGWKLRAGMLTAPTSGKVFNVQARWGYFAKA